MAYLYQGDLHYDGLPELSFGKLIVYAGKQCCKSIEEIVIPNYLYLLYDAKNRENDLYFLDESSLNYFVSENVGHDLSHTKAKLLRRGRDSYVKNRIRIDNVNQLKVKDFVKLEVDKKNVVQIWRTEMAKNVKIPTKRLKEQEVGKE